MGAPQPLETLSFGKGDSYPIAQDPEVLDCRRREFMERHTLYLYHAQQLARLFAEQRPGEQTFSF